MYKTLSPNWRKKRKEVGREGKKEWTNFGSLLFLLLPAQAQVRSSGYARECGLLSIAFSLPVLTWADPHCGEQPLQAACAHRPCALIRRTQKKHPLSQEEEARAAGKEVPAPLKGEPS